MATSPTIDHSLLSVVGKAGRYPELKAEVEGMAKASATKSKGRKILKATPKSKSDKGQ